MKSRIWPMLLVGAALVVAFAGDRRHPPTVEPKPDNPEGLLRERWMMMTGGDNSVGARELLAAKEHVERMPLSGAGTTKGPQVDDAGLWNWEWLGPQNTAGRVRAILFDPANSSRFWVGAATGGLWVTSDGGASWAPVNDFLPSLSVTSLAVDTGTGFLYAGTGEFAEKTTLTGGGFAGAGVFRSTDGGTTWNQIASTTVPDFNIVSRIAVVAADHFVFAATDSGLFRSGNDGDTWTRILDQRFLRDVKAAPTTQRVLVGTVRGAFASQNSGNSWTSLTTETPGGLPDSTGRCEVAIAADETTAYISMNRLKGEVWRSTDGGMTWAPRGLGYDYLSDQGWYDNAIWVDPTNPNRIIVGGIDSWLSTDGGVTLSRISQWEFYPPSSAHADHHAIVHHPGYNGTTNRTVYFGNDGGVQRKDDILGGLLGWVDLSPGLGTTQFYKGAAGPGAEDLLGGLQDNGTLRYTGSPAWSVTYGGDGGYCAFDAVNGTPYWEYTNLKIFRPDAFGNPGEFISGLTDAGNQCTARFIAPFKADPAVSGRLVAGGASIWLTTNSAVNWTQIRAPINSIPTPPIANCPGNMTSSLCSAIELVPGSSAIWVGYQNGVVSSSTDGGMTWANLGGTVLPARIVTDIAVNPYTPNEVYVTFGGFKAANVWYTDNGGSTWEPRTGTGTTSLPVAPVETITIHPADPNWIYAGTSVGLLASEDRGLTWGLTQRYPQSEGPAYTQVSDLVWEGIRLVVFTYGRGVFRCTPLTVVHVDRAWNGPESGTASEPFNTMTEGVSAAGNGSTISVRAGTYNEAPINLQRRGRVIATGGTVRITGP